LTDPLMPSRSRPSAASRIRATCCGSCGSSSVASAGLYERGEGLLLR